MMHRVSWLGVFIVLFCHVASAQGSRHSLLLRLNEVVEQKDEIVAAKRDRLGDLHASLKKIEPSNDLERFETLKALANEYKTFIYDSAFSTIHAMQRVAYRLNDPVKIAYAKIQLALVMLSSGMFNETMDTLKTISVAGFPDSIRLQFYFTKARTYFDLGDYDKDRFYTPRYNKLGTMYVDSAIASAGNETYMSLYLNGLKNLKNENTREAMSVLHTLLTRHKLNHHQLAVTASTLSYFYISRNENDQAVELLARAAIADVLSATKETSAMYSLAAQLYREGDISNAYKYIQHAMEDAVFYGARQRKVQVGSIMPLIASAKINNVEEQRRLALIYAAVITILTILVIVFAVITLKQLKKRKAAERALQEANKIKEEYIGYYFNVNSEYLGKIEAFKKSIEMSLMTKKIDEIKFTVNSINPRKEREELYHSFDKVFLKLFPDFVDVFNTYFREEDRVVLKEGQLLNTELRIFALIRMGINSNEKIARILDYSINTIYNYKNRVKSKSLIPNEEFEKKIMDIHAL